MPISLDQFRAKVEHGDAERLEINRAGSDLHRKGMSRGGRAVEWMRNAVGARKAENREVMHAFVAAMKVEHGDRIGSMVENVLQGHQSKPLASRQVKELINQADTLRNSMRLQNQETAQLFAPSEQNDRALGYMSAVAAAAKAMGAPDLLVDELFDYGPDSQTTGVRDAIRQAIEAAGKDGKRVVSNDEARAIAQQKVAEFMGSRMGHEVTMDQDFRPAGSAADALEQVKSFRAQRLNARLGGAAGADPMVEQELMRDMSAQIGKLDNSALLKLYRTTLSPDMVEMRLALANRQNDPQARLLLEDLNSYEAMVQMEVIERTLPQTREVDDFRIIDHGPERGRLGAQAATEKRAAQRELDFQTDSYLRGDDTVRTEHPGAGAKLANAGVTTAQVADALRSADLTINLGLKLFAKGGGFRDQSGKLVTTAPRMKNIYELPQTKGPLYLDRRKAVEYALEPATEQADRSGSNIDPSDHPISAGVNVGRRIDGAAPGYGDVVLVLKDSVKDRCTFTPSDSFNAFEARVTRDKIELYKAKVAEMLAPGGGLQEADRKALLDDPTKLNAMFAALDQMEGEDFGAGRPFLDAFQSGPLREVDPNPASLLNYQLANAAIDAFRDRPGAGGHVTTSERMSHLIADLNKDVVDQVVAGVQDDTRINLPINNYIEAQVYGGVDLASDVAEIRYFAQNTGTMTPQRKKAYLDSVEGVRQLGKELGVRVVQHQPAEANLTRLT